MELQEIIRKITETEASISKELEKDNLEQGEIGKVNWIKELKAEMAADKKKEKEEE